MYKILKYGRKATKHLFASYEAARQWVRKQQRMLTTLRRGRQPAGAMSVDGYKIVRVA